MYVYTSIPIYSCMLTNFSKQPFLLCSQIVWVRNLGRAQWGGLSLLHAVCSPSWEEFKVELRESWLSESLEGIFVHLCLVIDAGWNPSWAITWNIYTVVSSYRSIWTSLQHDGWVASEQGWSVGIFMPESWKSHNIISVVFYWSSQSQRLSRFKESDQRPCPSKDCRGHFVKARE